MRARLEKKQDFYRQPTVDLIEREYYAGNLGCDQDSKTVV
jgi:hypothetical protein